MTANKARKFSRKTLDKLFMPTIKRVSKNGYFSCSDTFDDISESSIQAIKKHYENKGFSVEVTEEKDVRLLDIKYRIRIKISW